MKDGHEMALKLCMLSGRDGPTRKWKIVDYRGGKMSPGVRRKACEKGEEPKFDLIPIYGTRWVERSRYTAALVAMLRRHPETQKRERARRVRQIAGGQIKSENGYVGTTG